MAITVKNFFANLPAGLDGETFATLFENANAKIERIVSHTHPSPAGFWYDQDDDEWVIVLSGDATLEFDNGELVEMNAGDYLTIPRHVKHRVARTSEETIWLAVHVK
ncbi:MAG: cupin domain-containing protein [Gammaproteobacteria bacterium]